MRFEKELRRSETAYEKERRNKKMCIGKDMQLCKRSAWHTDMQIEEEVQTMASAAYSTNRTEEEKQMQRLVLCASYLNIDGEVHGWQVNSRAG